MEFVIFTQISFWSIFAGVPLSFNKSARKCITAFCIIFSCAVIFKIKQLTLLTAFQNEK